jgi:hypothetical protein
LFSGPALAQEDYTSPLAGIKSINDLVNGAGAPEEADEDYDAFDGLWFDDAWSDGAQQRAAALVEEAGWVCDAWPMEGGDPMRTQMFAAFTDNGDLFIREENFASMDGQTLQVTIEYTADVVTDETDTEVTVGTKSSKVTGVTGLPEGVSLKRSGASGAEVSSRTRRQPDGRLRHPGIFRSWRRNLHAHLRPGGVGLFNR